MLNWLWTSLFSSSSVRETPMFGPDYRPAFSIYNPQCYGESHQIEGHSEYTPMVIAMINSKKDVEAINFAREDLPKYDILYDYVYYTSFPASALRF